MSSRAAVLTISTTLETPGRFAVFARKGERYGTSNLIGFNIPESKAATTRSLR